ncbi:PREDICTED: eukaryotic translation initiation factor 4E-binding protein 1 [Ceratosolen solmsi marchali]|uniref:Eukaryotic translation initiation factor 4E-binding protein 1 n=1 Tax=Ceratosolen solmsi marchali TaxID=326594 RepID=A0AAJ6YM11_9HYME|nr:PREDICTED: eukaryotic translation initiation factor 4E-binding protein 1 [Ceratosolen solmsi marchali]
MSASPIARQATQSQSIPASKSIVIQDANQMPADYSSTPGGTLYSTTPGGTRIVYERAFLMNLRNSPISQTPPKNLPSIPTNLLKSTAPVSISSIKTANPLIKDVIDDASEQFEMDM